MNTENGPSDKDDVVPLVWHPITSIDFSSGIDISEIPTGGFERIEILFHSIQPLDFNQ